jgi:hypothetical protein
MNINALGWAFVKCRTVGQYEHARVRHFPRYLDEFDHRFDQRNADAEVMFGKTLARAVGARE